MKKERFRNGGSGLRVPENIHPFKFVAFICTLAFVILSIIYVAPFNIGAYASGSIRLSGHVPGLIYNSQMLGPTDPNTPISLMVGLRLRNAGYLQALVDTHARPYAGSAERHLSAAQFAQDYAPLPESQDAVIAYMQQAGFKVSMTFNHRLLVGFKGTIGLAEKTFQVQINNYRARSGRHFYAPTSDPSVPASLAPVIQSIIGLDTAEYFTYSPVSIPAHVHKRISHFTSNNCPTTSNSLGFLPSQIATAYNLKGLYNEGFYGQGQTVALFELDNYVPTDISDYTACYGGSSVPIFAVPINGGPGTPGAGAFEVELDMELVLSAAPQLASLRVYEAHNDITDYMAEWAQIVSDDVPVVSTSWGSCETNSAAQSVFAQENTLLTSAAAQGQSIFAAAGDSGSNGCNSATPAVPSVDDPASQPYVTGVGGTSLSLNTNNSYKTETVWKNGYGAGGGGVSSLWIMPTWQQGSGVINTMYSSGAPCKAASGVYCREVPDVSFDADPTTGYVIYCSAVSAIQCNPSTPWLDAGGTSAAAPMWAAMIALANQKSVNDGHSTLGFLNPLLYKIDQGPVGTYNQDFHDVEFGTNYTTGDGKNEYPALPNYDMASGLGSYNALNLAIDLETLAVLQSPPPTPTASVTATATQSPTASISPTVAVSPTIAASPSVVPSPCPSVTPLLTPTATTSPTTCASPTPSPSPTTGGAPVGKTWYFAEGKVGAGFTEYLTFENPDNVNDCVVNIQYLLGIGNPVNESVTVLHASRFTESVNSDLDIPANSGFYQTDSAIVTVNSTASPNCMGIVAERPMYFTDFTGVSSGSDVLGSTHAGKTFYFADVPTGGGYASFITILNPGSATANITASYDVGGTTVNTQMLAVPGMTRGTIIPTNTGPLHHAAVVVTSDLPVVVERPDYFSNVNGGNAQTVSGATSVVGAQALKNDWLFAEGYTGSGFQEYFVLANFSTSPVMTNVVLEFSNGHTETMAETIQPLDQTFVDVNAIIANRIGTCDTNPCQVTQDVSAEITASSSFIAEREMYFHYTHIGNGRSLSAIGGTDIIGEPGPASATTYSFAEGYTNDGYDEWLTLQNPTANSETLNVMLVNEDGHTFNQSFNLVGHSRFTVDITAMVMQHLIVPNDTYRGYEVSMVVQSSSGAFVAERPMYWDTGSSGTQGGSDVSGYLGG